MILDLLKSNNLEDIILGCRMISNENIRTIPWKAVADAVSKEGLDISDNPDFRGHAYIIVTNSYRFIIFCNQLYIQLKDIDDFYYLYKKVYDFR